MIVLKEQSEEVVGTALSSATMTASCHPPLKTETGKETVERETAWLFWLATAELTVGEVLGGILERGNFSLFCRFLIMSGLSYDTVRLIQDHSDGEAVATSSPPSKPSWPPGNWEHLVLNHPLTSMTPSLLSPLSPLLASYLAKR